MPARVGLLHDRGVGIEACLASVADAERFVNLQGRGRVLRVLIEIQEQAIDEALRLADEIAALLDRRGSNRPVLLHGFETTVWAFVDRARRRLWYARVGLGDGCRLIYGQVAAGNAALVTGAVKRFGAKPYTPSSPAPSWR